MGSFARLFDAPNGTWLRHDKDTWCYVLDEGRGCDQSPSGVEAGARLSNENLLDFMPIAVGVDIATRRPVMGYRNLLCAKDLELGELLTYGGEEFHEMYGGPKRGDTIRISRIDPDGTVIALASWDGQYHRYGFKDDIAGWRR
jgi:hypothetical protein